MATVSQYVNDVFKGALELRFPTLTFEFFYNHSQDRTVVRVVSKLEVSNGQYYTENINLDDFPNQEFIQKMILIA